MTGPTPPSVATTVPAGSSADFVVVEGVSRFYGVKESRVRVLDRARLRVRQGAMCVIVGASGSGKSTLLNAIGGLDRPDEGTISVAGTTITALSDRDLARYRRRHLGFVFQFYNLIPNLTVAENVAVCRHLSPTPMDVDELLATLGLAEHRDKFPAQLSGGQQQRCAIARALVKRPDLLLCDEPTGALDYESSRQMLRVLEEVNRDLGSTLIMVTHNDAVTAMADQVVALKDGRIVRETHNSDPLSAADLEW
ncbi:MAG: ABC transporter ATP-binding protein [Micropruina sp.]|nr:MAG: ABC transporter ATP-binding protein [Micropruina sp.]